ncbi:MAG: hypothetical protein ACE366_13950 [Bradymonadia bacterium]
MRRPLTLLLACIPLLACTEEDDTQTTPQSDASPEIAMDMAQGPSPEDASTPAPDAADTPVIELRADLCADPANIERYAHVLDAASGGPDPSFGAANSAQRQRMVDAPLEGPFYMFNLIKYRAQAQYPDGRETDLTGREADALYAPIEFLTAIGARVVFSASVNEQIDGDDTIWETVAIVEYPCPLAFFSMLAHPEFQARSVHKEAGVEESLVMVTELQSSPLPEGFTPPESPFADPADPAFELVHVQRFHDVAQYDEGTDEPERTGQEAWEVYAAAGAEASEAIGVYPTARLVVQGVFIGDGREWSEINIVRMPSMAGFQALLEDEARQAGQHHRRAALADNYSLISYPNIQEIPGAPSAEGGGQQLPVTEDGTGTFCQSDDDCPSEGASTCFDPQGQGTGFCTREGCDAGECQGAYACCRDCSAAAAAALPFDGSICLPGAAVNQLTAAPLSCTCD